MDMLLVSGRVFVLSCSLVSYDGFMLGSFY